MGDLVQLTLNISEADALLALQAKLKKNPGIQAAAKSHNTPIYVTKTSSLVGITKAIRAMVNDHASGLKEFGSHDNLNLSEKMDALEEARIAIEHVVIPKGEHVELLPRSSQIISLQMDLIRKYRLVSEKLGTEPDVHLRIVPHQRQMDEDRKPSRVYEESELDDFLDVNSKTNRTPYSVDRLPLLPDQSTLDDVEY